MDLFGNEDSPSPAPHSEILVTIPEGFYSDDDEIDEPDLIKYFNEKLTGSFRDALDLDLEGDRENVDDVKVTSVSAENGSVIVEYTIEFSAYLGCKDQNYSEEDQRSVEGVSRGKHWIFTRHVTPERLAPNEEL